MTFALASEICIPYRKSLCFLRKNRTLLSMKKQAKIQRHFAPCAELKDGSVVAIGNFDGVHKGHQSVLKAAKALAEQEGLPVVMMTFEPHPRRVLTPNAPGRITPFADKVRLASRNDVDIVSAVRFTKPYAGTSAETFMKEHLGEHLNAKHVVVGDDFAFGRGREGSAEAMQGVSSSYGFTTHIVPAVKDMQGVEMASTLIREALESGNLNHAKSLLGYAPTLKLRFCEGVASLSRYATIKNGEYLSRLLYSEDFHDNVELMRVVIKDGELAVLDFPPVDDAMPIVTLELLEKMN